MNKDKFKEPGDAVTIDFKIVTPAEMETTDINVSAGNTKQVLICKDLWSGYFSAFVQPTKEAKETVSNVRQLGLVRRLVGDNEFAPVAELVALYTCRRRRTITLPTRWPSQQSASSPVPPEQS